MFSRTIRHTLVALGLVAVAGVTASSAAGLVHATRHLPLSTAERVGLPTATGDLGEVVVRVPGNFGAGVVHGPHDLGEVLVEVPRAPVAQIYFTPIVVTARRDDSAAPAGVAVATVAAVR